MPPSIKRSKTIPARTTARTMARRAFLRVTVVGDCLASSFRKGKRWSWLLLHVGFTMTIGSHHHSQPCRMPRCFTLGVNRLLLFDFDLDRGIFAGALTGVNR